MMTNQVRQAVRRRLCEWDAGVIYEPHDARIRHKVSSTDALLALFGFKGGYYEFQNKHGAFGKPKDHDIHNTLLALAGPHGYAIYKAMKARGTS